MEEYKFNDGLCHAGRTPRLYLCNPSNDDYIKFIGSSMEGFCQVKSQKFQKNGKWSNTTYVIALYPFIKPVYMLSPMHGTWGEGFTSWLQVMDEFSLSLEKCKEIVRYEYKKTAERLDGIEAFENALPKSVDMECVIINFGRPTNRQIAEGYWSSPKSGKTSCGEEVEISPGDDFGGWSISKGPEGSIISDISHSPGMHGGYVRVKILCPCTVRNENEK